MSTKRPQRVLIVRFGAIGDIVLTLPAVKALKTTWPETHITYLTKTEFAPLVKHHPAIDAVMCLESGESAASLRKKVTEARIDGIIDLHSKLRSRAMRWFHPTPTLAAKSTRSLWEAGTVRLGWAKHEPKNHIVEEHHLIMDQVTGTKVHREKIQFSVSADQSQAAQARLTQAGFDFNKTTLGISPGANWYTKRWPIENFIDIARRAHASGLQVLTMGNSSETSLGKELAQKVPTVSIFDAPLDELGALIQSTSIYLGNDSGPMHIARGLGVPTVAIFGSTSPKQFNFDTNQFIYTSENCSPCHFYGRKACPKQHLNCLSNISADQVWETLTSLNPSQ